MLPGMGSMLDLTANDLQGLEPEAVVALAQQLQQHIEQQAREIELKEQLIQRQASDIAWRDARLDKLNFELARLKRWKFGARTEAMTAQQRALFAETLIEDEASLEAQLAALRATMPEMPASSKEVPRRPRRQALPEHLKRVEHRHEPEDTHCPTPGCGRPMTRVGEDVSEKLDIVPAQFFVHRHIYGKWACRCCERLVQEPAEPDVIDGGIAASGLVAHTLISRFVDHLPYYRQEDVNARSGVHTPRSTLASWGGRGGAGLQPLNEAHKRFVLSAAVLHADETPVPLLDPGRGKTKKAYVWAYARSPLDGPPGVIYDFCNGRGAQYPLAFLGGKGPPYPEPPWRGTLVCDQYAAYAAVLDPRTQPGRQAAGCAAHARRRFEELSNHATSASPVALEAMQRWARIYHVEGLLAGMTPQDRLDGRQRLSRPLWDELHVWLKLQRQRVIAGGAIAQAIDYSLNGWDALTLHLSDGRVAIGRVEMWRGGRRSGLSVSRPFRLAVPHYPRRSSVSTSPSSNRTCGSPASGSPVSKRLLDGGW